MATLTTEPSALSTRPKKTRSESPPLSVKVIRHAGPGCLAGIRLGDWLKLLWENQFRVSPCYWGKLAHLTCSSLVTSPLSWLEQGLYAARIRKNRVEAPVFVLGSWRSGTTHLHNLLSQDDRFATPDFYETMYPRTYCLSRWWWEPLLKLGLPKQRFMDNVSMDFREPAEDEMAIAVLSQKSNMLSWTFPQREGDYERFLTFKNATPAEQSAFQQALRQFVQKVQTTRQKPLILKSPNHTARIKLLLEIFPQARFVHIRRHPYNVFRSFLHMVQQVIPVWGLQKYDLSQVETMVLRMYRRLYQAYFAQRELIPAGQLHELSYEELVEDPQTEIRRIYHTLNLPDFQHMEPQLARYLEKVKDYSANEHPQIPARQRQRLHHEWGFCFKAWNYEQDFTGLADS